MDGQGHMRQCFTDIGRHRDNLKVLLTYTKATIQSDFYDGLRLSKSTRTPTALKLIYIIIIE